MKEINKSTLFGLRDFPKRGKSAHLMCASLNAPWALALGFCSSCFRSARRNYNSITNL